MDTWRIPYGDYQTGFISTHPGWSVLILIAAVIAASLGAIVLAMWSGAKPVVFAVPVIVVGGVALGFYGGKQQYYNPQNDLISAMSNSIHERGALATNGKESFGRKLVHAKVPDEDNGSTCAVNVRLSDERREVQMSSDCLPGAPEGARYDSLDAFKTTIDVHGYSIAEGSNEEHIEWADQHSTPKKHRSFLFEGVTPDILDFVESTITLDGPKESCAATVSPTGKENQTMWITKTSCHNLPVLRNLPAGDLPRVDF